MKSRRPDGAVHFSDLKQLALSPAHYLNKIAEEHSQTPSMIIGTGCHRMVLGGPPIVVFPHDDRKAAGWKAFKEEHEPRGFFIMTRKEHAVAAEMANSVQSHPVAADILKGARCEVSIEWHELGMKCQTGGVDFLRADLFGDLKTTMTSDPNRFSRMIINMHYHCQLAFYESGLKQNGYAAGTPYIIAVENKPPYPTTVFRLTDQVMDLARRTVSLWLEKLKLAEDNDLWPGYTQAIVDVDVPPWMGAEVVEEVD
jgi:hypothetical protein